MRSNRVHFEIPANQPESLTKFYSEVFGWKFQKAALPGPEYWLCETGADGPGINGAVMKREAPRQPWMNYVDVANIEATLEQATNRGEDSLAENLGSARLRPSSTRRETSVDSGSNSRADCARMTACLRSASMGKSAYFWTGSSAPG